MYFKVVFNIFFSLRQKSTPTTEFVTWIRWQKNWLMLFVKYNFQWGYVREANYTIYDHRVFICITIWNYNTYNTHISANMWINNIRALLSYDSPLKVRNVAFINTCMSFLWIWLLHLSCLLHVNFVLIRWCYVT